MQFIVLRSKNTTLFFIEIAEHMHSMLISWMSHEKSVKIKIDKNVA